MVTAAECLLASTLWTPKSATKQFSDDTITLGGLATRRRKIDNALSGGLNYGSISCISGEADTGAREVCQALLVSQLLNFPHATATIVDTGLSMDVRKLHQALAAQMSDRDDAVDQAMKVLDRVKIMKIFDFVGLTECLAELRDDLEGKGGSNYVAKPESEAPRGTVGDSEDEGEDEMLDTPAIPPTSTLPKPQPNHSPESSLLIIDSITQVVAPLLKTNYIQGQALLTSFMRSLAHLTKAHSICTVLINGVASNPNVKDEAPSIFSSCKLQPALGRAFTYMLDMHLLVHRVPRTAEVGAANGSGESMSVIEVLHDRYGSRTGQWAAFEIDDEGNVKDTT